MNRLPAEVRAMTPEETSILIDGWNESHSDDDAGVMDADEYHELVKRYG